MSSVTLKNTQFPNGSTVGCYSAVGYSNFPESGPPGTPVTTATASGNSVTFSGLEDNHPYWAAIATKVNGAWVYRSFILNAKDPESLHPRRGEAGPEGSRVLGGEGAPIEGEGDEGDFYIDTEAGDLYGPKAGDWGEPLSLIGPEPVGAALLAASVNTFTGQSIVLKNDEGGYYLSSSSGSARGILVSEGGTNFTVRSLVGDLQLDATSGNIDAVSNRIKNVAEPSSAQDAATKKYVEAGVIRGIVSSAGGASIGVGYTAEKNETGKYTITFSTEFGSTPVPEVLVSGSTALIATYAEVTKAKLVVEIRNAAGELKDASFAFAAYRV